MSGGARVLVVLLGSLGALSGPLCIAPPPLLAEEREHSFAATETSAGKIQYHLFGGDMRIGAPLAPWYRQIGITDVWLYPLQGAFPQDQRTEDQKSVDDLQREGILRSYNANGIRYWWMERPVPDYLYVIQSRSSDASPGVIWSSGESPDAAWKAICEGIRLTYGGARAAGFEGIVYDNEGYYSYVGPGKPWLWQGHDQELGPQGNYYTRGVQIGKAILSVWPEARVMMVYAIGYPGEYWWYKGFHDSGVDLYLAVEHTYGAGPAKAGDQWYQHWWRPGELKGVVQEKRAFFNFLPDDRHVVSGLFPIDFGAHAPNYDFKYFREQIEQASTLSGSGPFAVWIWPQGEFTPESFRSVAYPAGVTAEDYLGVMRSTSLQ